MGTVWALYGHCLGPLWAGYRWMVLSGPWRSSRRMLFTYVALTTCLPTSLNRICRILSSCFAAASRCFGHPVSLCKRLQIYPFRSLLLSRHGLGGAMFHTRHVGVITHDKKTRFWTFEFKPVSVWIRQKRVANSNVGRRGGEHGIQGCHESFSAILMCTMMRCERVAFSWRCFRKLGQYRMPASTYVCRNGHEWKLPCPS